MDITRRNFKRSPAQRSRDDAKPGHSRTHRDERINQMEARLGLSEYLSNFKMYVQNFTVSLPITTRGIGFAIIEHWNELASRGINMTQFNIYAIYRISLAQLECKMYYNENNLLHVIGFPYNRGIGISQEYLHQINSFTLNFGIVAQSINQVGTIIVDDQSYIPCIGRLPAAHQTPDPYTVQFSVLERLVQILSNAQVPQPLRQAFVLRNPLPGAHFDANFILTNPLDFWPQGYDVNAFGADIRDFSASVSIAAAKKKSWVADINYQSKGEVSMLVTTTAAPTDVFSVITDPNNQFVRCNEPSELKISSLLTLKDDAQTVSGTISLMGEYVEENFRNLYGDEFYISRNRRIHPNLVITTRAGMVTYLLQRATP